MMASGSTMERSNGSATITVPVRLLGWNVRCCQPLSALRRFLEDNMRTGLVIGLAALVSAALMPQAKAQDLGRILHAITEPDDARRYEEQAHRNGRPDEERYWQRYGAGLHEQQARQHGRPDEERYWHQYGEGLR